MGLLTTASLVAANITSLDEAVGGARRRGEPKVRGSPLRFGQHSSSKIQLKNEGLAFSLAGSNDGGLLLEAGNMTYLIFGYFTLYKTANYV